MRSFHDYAASLLRRLPPEPAHDFALWALAHGLGPRIRPDRHPRLRNTLWGLDFPNPIGLAAGFDKSAGALDGALGLGLGFLEVGGVTPAPQAGNTKPRLFRLAADRALINRMGFNNAGLDTVATRLDRPRRRGIVGVNLAANTDSRDPIADFVRLARDLAPRADILTADISCPNTQNGQIFLTPGPLRDLIDRLNSERGRKPLLVKLSPDLDASDCHGLVDVILAAGVDGMIIANTTKMRPLSLRSMHKSQAGGLSGAPLAAPALAMLRRVYRQTEGRLPLIGVGGIASGADVYARIRAGASLVQLYTALVYEGPGLIPRIQADLAACLAADGFGSVTEAVGADHA